MDYISIDSSQDIIEHYGIKGMKWGRRKLFYEKYSKWADNMHKMRDLGMKGMVIRRDQKVNDYRKALGYD